MILLAPTACFAEAIVEFCTPFRYYSTYKLDVTKPFIKYSLNVREVNGRTNIEIVADEIRIDRETLGSIIRSAAAVDEKIGKIRVDARRIIITESLALKEGLYEFVAEDVVFNSGAVLTLLPNPESRYSFAARNIRFGVGNERHFDVRGRSFPDHHLDDFSDINTILEIKANALWRGDNSISTAAAVEMLSRRFTRYPITDFSSKISVQLDDAGKAAWLDTIRTNAGWPRYTANVWLSAFRVAPFDQEAVCSLRSKITELDDVFQAVANASTLNDMQQLLGSMDSGVDLEGNGPAWATNRPLSGLLSELSDYEYQEDSYLKFDFYISALKASVDGTPIEKALQDREVGRISDDLRRGLIAYNNSTSKMAELQTQVAAELLLVGDLQAAYSEREKRLKEHAEELKRGAQDRAKIVSALATAASIAATAYTGNPATGSAVGGIIYAVGNATGGRTAWDSLSAGVQFAQAIRGPLESVQKSLGELKAARDQYKDFIASFTLKNITIRQEIEVPVPDAPQGQPTTRTVKRQEALDELAKKAKGLTDGVTGILDVYQKFVPTASPIDPVLEEDETLKVRATELAEALDRIKNITHEVEALQRITLSQQGSLVEAAEALSRITDLPVDNEEKRRALGSIAFEGARALVSDFSNIIEKIRNVSVLEYQEDIPVDPVLIQSVYVAEQLGEDFNPTETLTERAVGDEYVKLIEDRRTQIVLLASAVQRAAKIQLDRYVEFRGRAPSLVYPTEEITESSGSPATERKFIGDLNDLLSDEYKARKLPNELARLYSVRLEIPFDLKRKIDTRIPARLLQIAVTGVGHNGRLSGGDLVFTIDVERVGNLRRSSDMFVGWQPEATQKRATCTMPRAVTATTNGECVSVDLRPKEPPPLNYNMPYEYTIEQINTGNSLRRSTNQSYWYLSPGDSGPAEGRTMLVTYPPAEARTYLRVRLDPNTSWGNAPHISRVDITAEVFQ
ncbi:MAG: hypothetical protein E5Y31_00985 [Mesorhizobium sp.]|nr:MAG: hypothetical protein E5Y31_00985 [Mesorhizobium sp.]